MTHVYTADWVLPVEGDPIENGGIAIEQGRIVRVGAASSLDGPREHFPEAVIAPGFVNAHTHLEYGMYAGFGEGLPFGPWLDLHMERKRRLSWDDHVAIARHGAAVCLASGITTVADASFTGASALACAELGLRAIVHLEVFGNDAEAAFASFEERRAKVATSLSDRVRAGLSPHAPYSAGPAVFEAALASGLPVAAHVAESDSERAFMCAGEGPLTTIARLCGIESPGRPSVEHLEERGLLRFPLVAIHCAALEPGDVERLAGGGVAVAHCPRSNGALGCGFAPIRELLDAGVTVGLGTDSPASVPSFDVFEEMRAALLLARASGRRPEALTASEVLGLATLGAARVLGLEDEIGSLVPGKRADLVVVSLGNTPFLPWEDPVTALVLGGAPERVSRTIVDGTTRYQRGGQEWHELRQSARSARGRMLGAPLRSRVS